MNEILLVILFIVANLVVVFVSFNKKNLGYLQMLFIAEIIFSQLFLNINFSYSNIIIVVGSINFAFLMLIIDIINEFFSRKDAQKTTFYGMVVLCLYCVSLLILKQVPSKVLNVNFFSFQIRSILTDIILSYGIMQFLNIWLFDFVKTKTKSKALWLRTSVSTFIAQTLTAFAFYEIVYFDSLNQSEIIKIVLSGLTIKYCVLLLEIPLLYILKMSYRNSHEF